jgi:hypothetical protein
MRTLTFKRYCLNKGDTLPAIRWTFVPVDLDEKSTLIAAGFDPKPPFWFGVLPAAWKGHPRLALVVTGKTVAPGEFIAVSNEPGVP